MRWLAHAGSNISALPGSDFFLLRLSPAQLACMSPCTEKARSNLSCECVLAESQGGLDTSGRSGCMIRERKKNSEAFFSFCFLPPPDVFGWFDLSGPPAIVELNQCETSAGWRGRWRGDSLTSSILEADDSLRVVDRFANLKLASAASLRLVLTDQTDQPNQCKYLLTFLSSG